MIILGIDPGFAIMGYGVIETDGVRHKLIQYGALTTEAKTPTPARLLSIYTGIRQVIDIYKPDQIAFEELFFSKNVTTGMMVSAARGAALVAAAQYTQELYEYTPMQIKQAVTGSGRADKQQVQAMVRVILGMRETPKPDDAADALAAAITHAHSMKAGALFKIV
ncbi:MAG: crossover junction endodeoxyribonuclease RuvC [Clostridiales bacterium]|nr:crossover junction endodeoxyribonuclease RuvC [Clostridiales bacterium]